MVPDTRHAVLYSMGTAVHLTMCGVDRAQADAAETRAGAAFKRLDDIFSRFRDSSELAQLNARSGEWNDISGPMATVIGRMLELARETEGLLDPSVGGYLAAAGYGLPKGYSVPFPMPDWRAIELDRAGLRMRCARGQILEPAAIVKGMAIDDAGRALAGIPAWMINAGGDILTQGAWPGQGHWNVAIRDPFDARAVIATVRVRDESIATSGNYEVRSNGWHHQIDMRNGQPTQDLVSATVIADTAEDADTLASLLFLAGSERGPSLMSARGRAYLCIDRGGRRFLNDQFRERLVIP